MRQGVVSAEDLDVAVTQSLGLRWATGGPFRSMHLGGGRGGIQDFFQQFAGGLQLLWLHMRLRPVFLTSGARRALSDGCKRRTKGRPSTNSPTSATGSKWRCCRP